MSEVKFRDDLVDIIESFFLSRCISYGEGSQVEDLAASYCEMRIRHIEPKPRHVSFSNELNETLGRLANETNAEGREKAMKAWGAVFRLWHLFTIGGDVTPYLSKGIKDATSRDCLLWDFGMHHFHLGGYLKGSGFAKRSDYLLFAIVGDENVFFVDVRKHSDPHNLQWVRQDLVEIVHLNWPAITDARVLREVGVSPVTDMQKKELRRKNVNATTDFGGKAIAPLGLGITLGGGSLWCRMWAMKLLRELEWHERVLQDQTEGLRASFANKGVEVAGSIDCRLIPLDSMDATTELFDHLQTGDHLSKGLYAMGFAIVEATSGYPVIISRTDEK